VNGQDIEAVEKVLPEAPLLDVLKEVPIGGRYETDVHLDRLEPPDPLECLLLDNPQELYLHLLGQFPYFVEK